MPDKDAWLPQLPDPSGSPRPSAAESEGQARESDWYLPVAEALVDRGICAVARPCGDLLNGPKWTNPDVVGLIRPDPVAAVHNFPAKLVAVEVKRATDPNSLLTGFAEACAYSDFAHMCWLVAPWCDNDSIWRVERLCAAHGLGLAYAHEDDGDGETALWLEIGVRPRCREPDGREFAEFLKRLKNAGIEDF